MNNCAKRVLFLILSGSLLLQSWVAFADRYTLASPNGKLLINIAVSENLSYSVSYDGEEVIAPSAVALLLARGEAPGKDLRVSSAKRTSISEYIESPYYRQSAFSITCNQLELFFRRDGLGVRFRAYDEGFAWSFYTKLSSGAIIIDEVAEFNFVSDHKLWAAYSTGKTDVYQTAFQNTYTTQYISEIDERRPVMTPLAVDLGNGRKMLVTDGGQESYPGMFLKPGNKPNGIAGLFAPYPAETQPGAVRSQPRVDSREDHIAEIAADSQLPWRIGIISEDDTQLPVNNIIYALAPPSRIGDISWIKPGKIAWDWWSDWGITGVDFTAGINTATYKYLIDFASDNGIEYVVLDEGWSSPSGGNVMEVIPEIDLSGIVSYASGRNVGILLWVVMDVLDRKLEEACEAYSAMGVKGFKIDFLDRDDQPAIDQTYRVLEATARQRLVVDLHGALKPFGINRTYPHVLNVEGVFGLEELKWSNPDMPLYDVTMPFIRMSVGNVDYTPGAMTNANKANFRDIYKAPMSQGTRAHQAAMYIVLDAPMTTLCDSPSAYMREPAYTGFIASIPTVFDQTIIPAGSMGEYIISARKKGEDWYLGGLTDWTARNIVLDLDFLNEGVYKAEIIRDGVNAASRGEDYVLEKSMFTRGDTLNINMAPGGGVAVKFIKVK